MKCVNRVGIDPDKNMSARCPHSSSLSPNGFKHFYISLCASKTATEKSHLFLQGAIAELFQEAIQSLTQQQKDYAEQLGQMQRGRCRGSPRRDFPSATPFQPGLENSPTTHSGLKLTLPCSGNVALGTSAARVGLCPWPYTGDLILHYCRDGSETKLPLCYSYEEE